MYSIIQRIVRGIGDAFNVTSIEQNRSLEALMRVVEQRSRTLEYLCQQNLVTQNYAIDFLQKLYVEAMPSLGQHLQQAQFNATAVLTLNSAHRVAVDSNDHINPDSTLEGAVRPTLFVHDVIKVLGPNFKALDLGTGAAGLVFEFAANGVLAVGIDGSDFCRRNRIGYWPLLPHNLLTCDITKPFSFSAVHESNTAKFDLITMWEVLEHLHEHDLPELFRTIESNLSEQGFFVGSVSLVEYSDANGSPYHVTLKPREWWNEKFASHGLEMLDTHPFCERFFPRGNGPRYQDFHNYHLRPMDGFLFVAKKTRA